jgi:hypothetical protein
MDGLLDLILTDTNPLVNPVARAYPPEILIGQISTINKWCPEKQQMDIRNQAVIGARL